MKVADAPVRRKQMREFVPLVFAFANDFNLVVSTQQQTVRRRLGGEPFHERLGLGGGAIFSEIAAADEHIDVRREGQTVTGGEEVCVSAVT